MFTEMLFTEGKIWKEPKCPSTDEWIKNTHTHTHTYTHTHTHTGILPSHKKEWNLAIYDYMDEREHFTKWNKSDKEKQIPHDVTYVES